MSNPLPNFIFMTIITNKPDKVKTGLYKVLILCMTLFIFLTNCAKTVIYSQGLSLINNKQPLSFSRSDSLFAVLSVSAGARKGRIAAAYLYSLPGIKSKIEFQGPMGSYLGGFLWRADSGWSMVIPEEGVYCHEKGDSISLPFLGVSRFPLSLLIRSLQGRYVPVSGLIMSSSNKDNPLFLDTSTGRKYELQPSTGLVLNVTLPDGGIILYSDYKWDDGQPLAGQIEMLDNKGSGLNIRVKKVVFNPTWRRSPFYLKVPRGAAVADCEALGD